MRPPHPVYAIQSSAAMAASGATIALLAILAPAFPLAAQEAAGAGDNDEWDVTLARGETRDIDFTTEGGDLDVDGHLP